MVRFIALARFTVLLGAQAAALVLLLNFGEGRPWLAVDWTHPIAWLNQTSSDDAFVALLRAGGIGLAGIGSLGSVVHIGARVARLKRAIRWSSWMTLPAVRRAVDRLVVTSLVAGLNVPSPGFASEEPPPPHPLVQMIERDTKSQSVVRVSTHTVERGDSLWSIAVERAGVQADLAEVADLWLRIIHLNEGTLRSGNPDLIYPGEVVALPGSLP